jgi:hypothetical protein
LFLNEEKTRNEAWKVVTEVEAEAEVEIEIENGGGKLEIRSQRMETQS